MIPTKLKAFLAPSDNYADQRSYRRAVMTNFILNAILFSTVIFFFLNLAIEEYLTAGLDVIGFFISLYALYQLKVHNDLERVTLITTISFLFFFLLFAYFKGNSHFGLIWSIYAPIIAFTLNNKDRGLIFSILFYTALYLLAYLNIGIWNDGMWGPHDLLRLFFASNILVYLLYMHERSAELSDFKLNEVRAQEQKYIEQLRELSITDSLTKLYNRHYFNEFMPKLLALAKRKRHYITFFILDVDDFKAYNDHYGHIAGDKALIAIADAVIRHIQRDDDFVFRFGGEEFGGVLLSDDPEHSVAHVKQLCPLVEGLKIEHRYSDTADYLTVSVGIITIPPELELTIEQIYIFADRELYKVKNNGKNHCSEKEITAETMAEFKKRSD